MSYLKYVNEERLNIARGLVRDATFEHKFGAVPSLSQSQTGTVWDINDTNYPWNALASANNVQITTVNAADNLKQITIVGLDSNYDIQSETLTANSSAAVTSSGTYLRVYDAYVVDGGDTNIANINITNGGSTTIARILAGFSKTKMAVYTVPAGYTGYLIQGTCTAQASADGTGNMFVRYFGSQTFRVGHTFEVTGGSQYLYNFGVPLPIPEKTDIDVRITTRSNNGRFTAAFDIILIKNDGTGLRS
jgi:hypothetical protein